MKKIENSKTPYQKPQRNTREYRVRSEGLLLDFLRENVKGYSRNNLKTFLAKRLVSIDGAPVTQFDYPVAEGDVIRIGATRSLQKNERRIEIIYEDEDLIAINKPSGLLSIADDKEKSLTAYRLVTDYVRLKDKKARIFVVHRIDKDTSGVLLFAKNLQIKNQFQDNWQKYAVKRGYYAVVTGKLENKEGTIKSNLFQTSTHLVYVGKGHEGQEAITHYKMLKENEKFSLLDVNIDTGRKNQIRVQLKDIGHPVVGDEKYKTSENPLKRLGLHAYALHLKDPRKEGIIKLTVKMPSNFGRLFEKGDKKPR